MMVTFVSQCEKKALNRTRRVLDAFADRIGDNTWQTVITQEGLLAVKKLLRKTASKNTAVSCHWIRSRSRSELVWVVGQKSRFNAKGLVPVNRSKRNLLHSEWESSWMYADSIQILAVLAALLHDIGKATIGFQDKLLGNASNGADPYRHEWISLRLFEAMIAGCSSDEQWLNRLANFNAYMQSQTHWQQAMLNDSTVKTTGFEHLPPLAQMVAWLIVTHHRLPFDDKINSGSRHKLQTDNFLLKTDMARFYKTLKPVEGWVKNNKACDERKDLQHFWQFKQLVVSSDVWQKAMHRWSNKALLHTPLMALSKQTIADPLLMHTARLCLMVGDHNYSSLAIDDKRRVNGDKRLQSTLIANTNFKTKQPKQALDEHLLGVANFTARFAKLLPQFAKELPTIIDHRELTKRTSNSRFQWQNKAYDVVKKAQQQTDEHGFFGVNMASTGCGKTLANARIMAGLSPADKGVRFTVALGLRVLTLQTGLALREKLKLDETSLAILVGGTASRKLFELKQTDNNKNDTGSESAEALVTETVNYDRCSVKTDELGTVVADTKARDLLYAPVVACTVDHIIGATETQRGGAYIAPMLRLLTSDLVLDEPDDFDQADLPALSRLVYMAGMLGSKVLLSSATLTPDLTTGLFRAYMSGRTLWARHNNKAAPQVVCAWFDEFKQQLTPCRDKELYKNLHQDYVSKRVKQLDKQPAQKIGHILPTQLPAAPEGENINNDALARVLMKAANDLHTQHHTLCSKTQKTASVGLIRMANIAPMVRLLKALYKTRTPANTQVHICCYHARQVLVLRNTLEAKLDRILQRSNDKNIFDHPEIAAAVNNCKAEHHIFIVLASPVAEVGRDHDYDWAIVEPSSMRSIIQLVGRVWRHRPNKVAHCANVYLLDSNIKALSAANNLGVGSAVFNRPGFESKHYLLSSHKLTDLISPQQLGNINAIARIQKSQVLDPKGKLADLEHKVMADLLNNNNINYVNVLWQVDTANHASVNMQRISPFRLQTVKQFDYIACIDNEYDSTYRFRYREKAWDDLYGDDSINSVIRYCDFVAPQPYIKPWLTAELDNELALLAQKLDINNTLKVARDYATVSLDDNGKIWNFNPQIGFWQ